MWGGSLTGGFQGTDPTRIRGRIRGSDFSEIRSQRRFLMYRTLTIPKIMVIQGYVGGQWELADAISKYATPELWTCPSI
jgi:hypothetical protein